MTAPPRSPSAAPDPRDARDHGRASERTSLAWTRTALSFAVIFGLIGRQAIVLHASWVAYLVLSALAACAVVTCAYGSRVARENRAPVAAGRPPGRPILLKLLVTSTTATALAALVMTTIGA